MFTIINLTNGVLILFSTGTILKRGESINLSVDSEALKAELQKLIKGNKIHMEEIKEEKKEGMDWLTQAVGTLGDLIPSGESASKEQTNTVEKKELLVKKVEEVVKKPERKWTLKRRT